MVMVRVRVRLRVRLRVKVSTFLRDTPGIVTLSGLY